MERSRAAEALDLLSLRAIRRAEARQCDPSCLALYPKIRLRPMLVDRLVNMVGKHVDAAIRIADLRNGRLITRKLGSVRILLPASPDYRVRRGVPDHPRDLADHDFIAWTALEPLPIWEFQEEGLIQAHQITAVIEAAARDRVQ